MRLEEAIDYDHVDEIIRKNYPRLNYRQLAELCKAQGYHCSTNSVRLRILKLGIKDNSKRDRIEAQRNYVREHIGVVSYKEMARILGVSHSLVVYYAKSMGYSYNYNRTK